MVSCEGALLFISGKEREGEKEAAIGKDVKQFRHLPENRKTKLGKETNDSASTMRTLSDEGTNEHVQDKGGTDYSSTPFPNPTPAKERASAQKSFPQSTK